ncbi:MAG: formylmethanofuran dehydrogenase [Proteobacteria bacterium]|nr:formylmethanofuran dehydrogenase [Pseudomonadota bacterium]
MDSLSDYMKVALEFHGHKCPAMPMGLRAGLAAMEALGVERSKDKELMLFSETGNGHAAGCFLDGLMTATGCTYGKGNAEKLHYHKMAFTLIDTRTGQAVRVSIKPDFMEKALSSPFIEKRKKGVLPQDVEPEITDPQVERILNLPADKFLEIGPVHRVQIEKKKGIFDARPCIRCGELTFIDKLETDGDGNLVCVSCRK